MILALLAAALRLWAPLALAALGGVVSERAGVINIGLEAMMLGGAFVAVAVSQATGSVLAGAVAGLLAGALIGLLHAFVTHALRVSHVLSGVGLNLGVLGLTTYGLRLYGAEGLAAPRQIPPAATTIAAALVAGAAWFVLAKTPLGLRLRACGENPDAARASGVNVVRLRYSAVITSGALAGLGGVSLALAGLGAFTENMTAGRGYIALAAVIFGRWSPLGAAAAALFFALGDAAQLALQTAGWSARIPPDFLSLLPYLLTLIALAGFSGRSGAPAALGRVED